MAKEVTTTVKNPSGAVVKQCSCKHEEQDKLHGKGMRVHNVTTKGYKCTVCGNINR